MKDLLETLAKGADYLDRQGIESARLNMELLLAHVLGCKRLDLYLMFDRPLEESELAPLRELTRRRASGEPLQHILGTVEFLGQSFLCDKRALIPRPETEELAAYLVKQLAARPPTRILDMGCGSGVLGLSLSRNWPEATCVCADISEEALALTAENLARVLPGRKGLSLVKTDLWQAIEGRFDLIVANLPYIPSDEIADLSKEVRHDPLLALDGGPDGLQIVHQFLEKSLSHALPDAWIALELGAGQSADVVEMAEQEGWTDLEILTDMQGIARFVLARHTGTHGEY